MRSPTAKPGCRDCPSRTDLSGLVHGQLSDDRQAELADHVGDCPECQEQMDSLATAGDPAISDVVRHIDKAAPPSGSAYWEALDRAEAAVTQSYPSDPETPSPDVKLDFLEPSPVAGRLGRLSSFDVIRVVGRGGMGVVLHAFDPYLQRDVAVKVLDPQLANNDLARQRFCREARAAASVSHDNLVAVHQVDEDDKSGLPFLVMQLVHGESLEQRLRRVQKLSVVEVVRVGMQAAAGLASAHASGLIHRDIKPGNILIEAVTEKVRLTDFGLARATEDLKLTRTGFVAGTPLYMAPEQARGDDVDARADLFSLGSVLYEALAGRPPFEGKTPLAVLRRVADEAHAPLRRVNPDVPEWLEEAIDRLLEKEPGDRFQSSTEVSELFACRLSTMESLSPLEVPAGRCGKSAASFRSPKAQRRVCRRTLAALLVVFAVGAVTGGVAAMLFAPRAPQDAAALPAVDEGPRPVRTLPGKFGAVWSAALSPNGQLLATGLENGTITIWDAEKGTRKYDLHQDKNGQLPAHKGIVWAVSFSADGERLVSVSDDASIAEWDLKTGRRKQSFPTGTSRSAAISPSGNTVAVGDRYGIVHVFDLGLQRELFQYDQSSTVNGVAFAPDELSIASVGSDGSILVWDVALNRMRFRIQGHTAPVYSVAFAPDGEKLATAGWDQTIAVWNPKTGDAIRPPIHAHSDGVWAVQFAPCCKVIASAGQDGKTKVWDAVSGELLTTLGHHTGTVHALRFSRDGDKLITGGRDGSVNIWDTGRCKSREKEKLN
jgi:WD40 repeat protein